MEDLGVTHGLRRRPNAEFWRGKRVLITGHSGFKGSWLTLWLSQMGAIISGLSLPPDGNPALFTLASVGEQGDNLWIDIRNADAVKVAVQNIAPDVVFHLAAQALVRPSYEQPLDTFAVNTLGTVAILEALRMTPSVRVAVMITTDKVYENQEWVYPYRENDPLGGYDPYSASKAACEIAIASYRRSFLAERGVALASARAGNVIGGGDWAKDRLLPDMVRAWAGGEAVTIRRPDAVRPWQHVLEALSGYLCLAEVLAQDPTRADSYNFGPSEDDFATVRTVTETARRLWSGAQVVYEPVVSGPHEAGLLVLDGAKTRSVLNYRPCWSLQTCLTRTLNWYAQWAAGADAAVLCAADIAAYEEALRSDG